MNKFSCGILGDHKTGKSIFGLSFPEPIKVCQADPNCGTLDALKHGGLDVDVDYIRTHRKFRNEFVPKVANGQFDAQTILVDSYFFLAADLALEIIPQHNDGRQAWGEIANRHLNTYNQLIYGNRDANTPSPYYIVVSCHMTEGKNGKYVPNIGGQFQGTWGRMFDMVLITDCETKSTLQQVKVPNSSTPITKSVLGETEYFAWTRPPSNLYNCGVSGDGLGGSPPQDSEHFPGTHGGMGACR
jgi:hypothetical protein